MRRISILILILLFTCLSNAFASSSSSLQKVYQVEDYFTVKLPDNLRVSISEKYHAITAMNGGIKQIITIKASPITQNFDDYVNDMQPRNPKSSLDGKGSIYIDNKEAQWLLFSYTESTKYYFLIYVIYSDQYCYTIDFVGDYADLETDRKLIEEVLSTIKILK